MEQKTYAKTRAKPRTKTRAKTLAKCFFASNCDNPLVNCFCDAALCDQRLITV